MRRVLLIPLLALLALPAPAVAQDCVAPPGTAAIDEYCETIPEATGDRGSPLPPRRVPPATLESLRELGTDGAKLADQLDRKVLAQRDDRRTELDGPALTTRGGGPAAAEDEPGSNPLDAVRSAVGTGARIEDELGWAIALVTLLIAGSWWVGIRRRHSP